MHTLGGGGWKESPLLLSLPLIRFIVLHCICIFEPLFGVPLSLGLPQVFSEMSILHMHVPLHCVLVTLTIHPLCCM